MSFYSLKRRRSADDEKHSRHERHHRLQQQQPAPRPTNNLGNIDTVDTVNTSPLFSTPRSPSPSRKTKIRVTKPVSPTSAVDMVAVGDHNDSGIECTLKDLTRLSTVTNEYVSLKYRQGEQHNEGLSANERPTSYHHHQQQQLLHCQHEYGHQSMNREVGMALISETRKQSSQDRQPLLPPPPPPAQSSLLPLLSSDTTDLIDWNDVKGDVYINDYDHSS